MKALDIQAALAQLTGPNPTSNAVAKAGGAAFTKLASFNGGGIFLGRFSGETPWECHPGGDELLHILEGEVEVTVRDGKTPVQVTLPTGSVFVVPRGRWHRQNARSTVTLLSATPTPHPHFGRGPIAYRWKAQAAPHQDAAAAALTMLSLLTDLRDFWLYVV